MEIRPLDASDPDALAAWHAAHHEAHRFGLEHASPWMLEEMRADFLSNRVGHRSLPFGGYVDGRVVVTGLLELPLLDNLTQAHVDVATPPAERRRGHGAAMLAHLTGLAVEAGRRTLLTRGVVDLRGRRRRRPAPRTPTSSPARASRSRSVDVKRLLPLPVDEDLLDRLAAEAATHLDGYTVRSWSGPVPEDVIDGFGRLVGQLITEAPMGEDQDFEAEVFDAARIRDDEKVMAEARAARSTRRSRPPPTARWWPTPRSGCRRYEPGRAYQWGTLVLPEHRGHRLGLATKVENLRRVQAAEPDRTALYTWNAEVNRHMIAVNEALGFRPVGRLGEFVKQL